MILYCRKTKNQSQCIDLADAAKVFYIGEGKEFDVDKNLVNLTDLLGDTLMAYGIYVLLIRYLLQLI